MKEKIMIETKVNTIAAECESIISCVENVIDLCDSNDFVTNLLQTEEFENIRFIAEELQSLVSIALVEGSRDVSSRHQKNPR